MYVIGDRVVYGIHGVCQIIDREQRRVDRRTVSYFVLEPVEQTGARFYVPCDNPAALAKLRPLISREELDAMLASPEVRQDCWITDENARKQRYRDLITSQDRQALLCMIGTLHRHKQEQQQLGRKFHICDENFLRDVEKLLNGEFSMVLEIQPQEVGGYIRTALEIK